MSDSIKRMTFFHLWDKAGEGSIAYDTGEVREWLEVEGWPTLFPGHCFDCDNSNVGDAKCDEHYPLSCPACVSEHIRRQK